VYVFTRTGTKFSQIAELTPSNPLKDEQFGMSVGISGSGRILVATAPGAAANGKSDQGAAYVFTDQTGAWTQIAELTVRGTAELGSSVAISADGSTMMQSAQHR